MQVQICQKVYPPGIIWYGILGFVPSIYPQCGHTSYSSAYTAYYVGGISEWEDIYKKFSGYWNVIPFTDTVEVKYGDYVDEKYL